MSKVTYDAGNCTLTVDDTEVSIALGELKSKTNAVMKVAINRTARQVRKDVIAESMKRYDLTKKGQEKAKALAMRRKATNAVLLAELRQCDEGMPMDFAYFRHTPTTVFKGANVRNAPEHVRGRVLKSSPMHDLTAGEHNAYGKVSKGFLVEFQSGHIGMVQRDIGSRSKSDKTVRGYRRWEPNETLVTMNRPGASSMGHAVWDRTVETSAEAYLMYETHRRLEEVIARSRSKK